MRFLLICQALKATRPPYWNELRRTHHLRSTRKHKEVVKNRIQNSKTCPRERLQEQSKLPAMLASGTLKKIWKAATSARCDAPRRPTRNAFPRAGTGRAGRSRSARSEVLEALDGEAQAQPPPPSPPPSPPSASPRTSFMTEEMSPFSALVRLRTDVANFPLTLTSIVWTMLLKDEFDNQP